MKSVRLYGPGPTWFEMEPIAPGVCVDRAMPPAERTALLEKIGAAGQRTHAFFGGLVSSPAIYACSTEDCFRTFGGSSSLALAFGRSKILLSPRGLTTPVISHEWSHAELHARLGGTLAMRRLPRWFDDGLAVVVSKEPSHSAEVWRQILSERLPHPELFELASASDWRKAVRTYGDVERSLGRAASLSVVYATAGHEVRTWHRQVGREGVLQLIEAVKKGERFTTAYERIRSSAALAVDASE